MRFRWLAPWLVIGGVWLAYSAYGFNTHWYLKHEVHRARLASLKPLGWNPYNTIFMTRPHEQKMLDDQRYLTSWYTSLGHAEMVVFLYTVL